MKKFYEENDPSEINEDVFKGTTIKKPFQSKVDYWVSKFETVNKDC
jgi:hypothetical protein